MRCRLLAGPALALLTLGFLPAPIDAEVEEPVHLEASPLTVPREHAPPRGELSAGGAHRGYPVVLAPGPGPATSTPAARAPVPAGGEPPATRREGTTLEAQQRDDGSQNATPWLVGSGVAAALAVGLGGWALKRRMDRTS